MLHIPLYICIISIAFSASSALWLLITRPHTSKAKHLDEIAPDATYNVRLQKAIIGAMVVLGTTCAVLSLIWPVHDSHHRTFKYSTEVSWANLALWGYIAILAAFMLMSTRHHVVFTFTCHMAVMTVLKMILSLTLLSDVVETMVINEIPAAQILGNVRVILGIVASLAAMIQFIALVSIPRAPQMEFKDRPVISLAYGSLWHQFLFSYTERVQQISRKQQSIEQKDLDMMMHDARAENLLKRFAATRGQGYHFVKRLWLAMKAPLLLQWSMSVVMGILMYAPAFFLLRVLDFIQEYRVRSSDERPQTIYTGLGWVAGMFVFKQISAIIDSQLWYLSAAVLQVNTRAAINLDIYDKTLRKQNTSGEIQEDEKAKSDQASDTSKKDDKKDEDKDALATSKQNVLNLMTVDADRIATFFTFCFLGIQAPIELAVSLTFLYQILG